MKRTWARWVARYRLQATFAFTLQNLVLVSLVPLSFSLFREVWILVGHTEHNWFLSREFVYIYRLVLQ